MQPYFLLVLPLLIIGYTAHQRRSRSVTAHSATRGDLNNATLAALKRAGANMRAPTNVVVYLYFDCQRETDQARTELAAMGFSVNIEPPADGAQWLCQGEKAIVPTATAIHELTTRLDAIADSLHGEFDGWEAEVSR